MKKLLSILLILLVFIPSCTAEESPLDGALRYLMKNTDSLAPASIGGDFTAIILSKNAPDNKLLADYRENAAVYVTEKGGVLHNSRYTEYSRIVYALSVTYDTVGLDPCNVAGYDIVTPLHDFDAVTKQGVNGTAWALMALDAEPHSDSSEIRAQYVSHILSAQNEDGSFGSLKHSEVDMTAMCLQALAAHTDAPEVAEACRRGVDYLASAQGESGGFPSPYGESSEPISQVLMALDALGLSYTDPRFTAEITLYDALLAYRNRDGGFSHNKDGGSDRLATEQAAMALIALAE